MLHCGGSSSCRVVLVVVIVRDCFYIHSSECEERREMICSTWQGQGMSVRSASTRGTHLVPEFGSDEVEREVRIVGTEGLLDLASDPLDSHESERAERDEGNHLPCIRGESVSGGTREWEEATHIP